MISTQTSLKNIPPVSFPGHDFFQWSFGGSEGASCLDARSDDFSVFFKQCLERRHYDFRHEVLRACALLDKRRKGRTIALCYSAGIDSELIARSLALLGIPFELYFLDIWGLNRPIFEEWSRGLLGELGKTVRIVGLSKQRLYTEQIANVFPVMGCEFPTYLSLSYLFDAIPADQFIVVGDGDLDRSGLVYREIAKQHPLPSGGSFLPFSVSRVAYSLWSRRSGREGEFYFFSSTPELVAAALTSPDFQLSYPQSDTRKMVLAAFPEIKARPKTTNWDSALGRQENKWVRARVNRLARTEYGFHFWRRGMGTVADLDRIFI